MLFSKIYTNLDLDLEDVQVMFFADQNNQPGDISAVDKWKGIGLAITTFKLFNGADEKVLQDIISLRQLFSDVGFRSFPPQLYSEILEDSNSLLVGELIVGLDFRDFVKLQR